MKVLGCAKVMFYMGRDGVRNTSAKKSTNEIKGSNNENDNRMEVDRLRAQIQIVSKITLCKMVTSVNKKDAIEISYEDVNK